MLHVLEHSIIDSLKVLLVVIILNIIISFFEGKLANKINKDSRFSTLLGSSIGIIPQCGFSIVASDMYLKKKITLGTLIAVFISTSDETLLILFSNKDTILDGLILILIKLVYAIFIGLLVDLAYKDKTNKECTIESHSCDTHDCHHHEEKGFGYKHFLHPLIHSLFILLYVFIVNFIFNTIIYFIAEEAFNEFLTSNKHLSPLFAMLVGLIPNCSSSVIITKLYVLGGIPFSALLSQSIVNAGLGLLFLFKNKSSVKNVFLIYLILIVSSLLMGYLVLLLNH